MSQFRFTLRQQEFARLYASGLSASKAALHAGYAQTTCEHNAQRLLAHPRVQQAVLALRAQQGQVTCLHLAEAVKRLNHTISYCTEERYVIAAIRELARLEAQQARRNPSATYSTQPMQQLLEQIMPIRPQPEPESHPAQMVEDKSTQATQVPNNQSKASKSKKQKVGNILPPPPLSLPDATPPQEQDLLPDGSPAADVRLSPQRPVPPSPPKHIIEIRNLLPEE